MIEFALALPAIRKRVHADLKKAPLSREHVLATVVTLLEKTLIRIGNKEYARANKSFGLTTLLDRARADQRRVGDISLPRQERRHADDRAQRRDARAHREEVPGAARARRCFSISTPTEGGSASTRLPSTRICARLPGDPFTAKNFRTWAATVLAAKAVCELPESTSDTAFKRNIVGAIDSVAAKLGNTRAVCRGRLHPSRGVRGLRGGRHDRRAPRRVRGWRIFPRKRRPCWRCLKSRERQMRREKAAA